MDPLQIDLITNQGGAIGGSGVVAHKLIQNGFNVNALRTNDVLRKEEWEHLDNALLGIAQQELPVTSALIARGLKYGINNGLGTTVLEWEDISDIEPAQVSMDGVTPGRRDVPQFTQKNIPLPIIHQDFSINIRKLEASRTRGQPLDITQGELASRKVMEKIEQMVFLGESTIVGGSSIPGLTTHANRNTGSVTANWDLITTTGEQRVDDVLAMINAAKVDNMYGPYMLLVTETAMTYMGEDYKANSDKTIIERIRAIEGISSVMASKDVPAGSVILVQLTKDVIDEVVGLPPTMVQWESNGGMTFNFKVMAIMIPRVRATQTGQSGVVHFS